MKKIKRRSENSLSNEKIRIEIEKLNSPWYKNIEFWKIIIPTIAIIFSLYFTFGRGIIDSQKEKLSIQKEYLKLEILQFEIKKGTVIEDINIIQKKLLIKEKELDSIDKIKDSLTRLNSRNKLKISNSRKELNLVSNERKLDKDFYQNKLLEQYQIEKEKAIVINNFKQTISDLKKNLRIKDAEIKYILGKYSMTKQDSSDLRILVLKAKTEHFLDNTNELNKTLKKIEENYKEESKRLDTMDSNQAIREFNLFLMRIVKEKE